MLGISILMILVGQTWAKAYDAGGLVEPSCCDTAYAIACDTFDMDIVGGAYVLVGHTCPGPFGGNDVLVTKVKAADGSVIWSRVYGFLDGYDVDDYGRSVIVDYDVQGGFYVIAGFTKPGADGSLSDALVFKVSAVDGSLVWGFLYSGMYEADIFDDYLYSIIKDGSDYLVAGNIEPGPNGGVSDVLVFSVNALNGSLNWSRAYGKYFCDVSMPKDDYAYSIIEDSSTTRCNLFVVAGKSYHTWEGFPMSDILVFKGEKSTGHVDPLTRWIYDYNFPFGWQKCAYSIKNDPHQPGYILTGDVDSSIVVMRLFPNLTVGWNGNCRIYTIPILANSRCIEPTSDINYVFTGFTEPGATASMDLLVTKIDLWGMIVWSKVLQGCLSLGSTMALPDYGQCIKECKPDTYVTAGYTDWPSPWNPTNLLVARMDANGNISCPIPDICMQNIETYIDSPEVYIDTSLWECPLAMPTVSIWYDTIKVIDTVICCAGGTGVEDDCSCEPIIYDIHNIPNPFTTETTIYYSLKLGCDVQLTIYDPSGRLIKRVTESYMEAGEYTVLWDGRDDRGNRLSPGLYFYKIQAGEHTETGKMILIQ